MLCRSVLSLWVACGCCVAAVADGVPQRSPLQLVEQVWASTGTSYHTTDSMAVCQLRDGEWMVFATAKDGNTVDAYDAKTGRFVARHGKRGKSEGEFGYPNGIVTARVPKSADATDSVALVLVIERDNARVQALWADGFEPAGTFGETELKRPYGGAISHAGGKLLLYVTDEGVPPHEAVKLYELTVAGRRVEARHLRTFGESEGLGAVRERESIIVDDAHDQVLLCDEAGHNVKVYNRAGGFQGRTFGDGLIKGDAEGIAILPSGAGDAGYVVVTDQGKKRTVWHVFDRGTQAYRGSFSGKPGIANTDGIWIEPTPFGPFERGALIAVHDDADLRAYDTADILAWLAELPQT